MKRKARIFLVIGVILFVLFVWSRTETNGDRRLSVYYVKKAITQSGKEIKLGWKFKVPADDPVVSIDIRVELDDQERIFGLNEKDKFFKEGG